MLSLVKQGHHQTTGDAAVGDTRRTLPGLEKLHRGSVRSSSQLQRPWRGLGSNGSPEPDSSPRRAGTNVAAHRFAVELPEGAKTS